MHTSATNVGSGGGPWNRSADIREEPAHGFLQLLRQAVSHPQVAVHLTALSESSGHGYGVARARGRGAASEAGRDEPPSTVPGDHLAGRPVPAGHGRRSPRASTRGADRQTLRTRV
jgi:hypothetical protein